MSELRLSFPGCRFRIRGPESALSAAALLYHESHLEPRAGAESLPWTEDFELLRVEDAWQLSRADDPEPLGRFKESVYALLAVEHAIEGGLLAALEDGVALHAGAVTIDGGACLLMGRADSGKSSTTFQLLELGHPFLAEEIAVVDALGRVRPHLQSLALDPRVVEELRSSHEIAHGRLIAVDELLHRYLPDRATTEAAPLRTIVLPFYRPNSPARVEPLGIEETLIELLGYCFEPPGDQEAFIERLIQLFSAARLLRLSYPTAAAARLALAELFGHGRS